MSQIVIPDELPKESFAVGGTPQSIFTFAFNWFADADIDVYVDGVLQTLTVDYTLAASVTYDNGYDGGTVTFVVAVSNVTVVVSRSVAVDRATNFPLSGGFSIAALNTSLSRTVAMIQDLDEEIRQKVAFSIGVTDDVGEIEELAADRIGKLIGFETAGKLALFGGVDVGLTVATAYMLTLLDDATAGDARTTLDVYSQAQVDASDTSTLLLAAPPGSGMDFWGSVLPTGWLWCDGSAVSRTTYAALFAAIGDTHGVGDGATTFNVPDKRGRVSAGKDDMGGVSQNRLTGLSGGVDGDVLGDTGGAETHTLITAELAAHTHTVVNQGTDGLGSVNGPQSRAELGGSDPTSSTGSGSAHNNVQPTIICNYIIKT